MAGRGSGQPAHRGALKDVGPSSRAVRSEPRSSNEGGSVYRTACIPVAQRAARYCRGQARSNFYCLIRGIQSQVESGREVAVKRRTVSLAEPHQLQFLGVTPLFAADYNCSRSSAVKVRAYNPKVAAPRAQTVCAMGARGRLARANSQLAPSLARPNLFSGD